MSCSNTVTISQGNSFACVFSWTPGASGPANLTATAITSTVEDRAGRTYELTVTKAGDGLSFTTAYEGSTSGWAIGLGRWDIKFVFPGDAITRSEVFRINVVDAVTL